FGTQKKALSEKITKLSNRVTSAELRSLVDFFLDFLDSYDSFDNAEPCTQKCYTKKGKLLKRKHNSYSFEQKKQVVAYAKENGRNKAAAAFKLDPSMVGRWIKA
ncbi:27073_t:CDS:2, partial [Racocetra persica]